MKRKLLVALFAVTVLFTLVRGSTSAWLAGHDRDINVGEVREGYLLSAEDFHTYSIQVPDGMVFQPRIAVDPSSSLRVKVYLDMWPTQLLDDSCDDPVVEFNVLHEDGAVPYLTIEPCPGTLDIDTPYTLTAGYELPLLETETFGIHNSHSIYIDPSQPFLTYLGRLDPGDVSDDYRFSTSSEAQPVRVVLTQRNSSLSPYLRLRRIGGGEIAYATSCGNLAGTACIDTIAPPYGQYIVEARTTGDAGDYTATFDFGPNRTSEPDNTIADVENGGGNYGEYRALQPLGDVDTFRLLGNAGEISRISFDFPMYIGLTRAAVSILSESGQVMEQGILTAELPFLDFVHPDSGRYFLQLRDADSGDPAYTYYSVHFDLVGPYISSQKDGLGNRNARKAGDLLARDASDSDLWDLVFDASDMGITRNMTAAEFLPNGTLLFSLDAPQTLPGLGKVMPQDIIRFVPTINGLGSDTVGTLEWYLDGSDVGLTTAGERIDAISLSWTNPHDFNVVVSLTGSGKVPTGGGGNLIVRDEDLIVLRMATYGAASAGKWAMLLDGSTIPGMAAENLTGATLTALPSVPDTRGAALLLMKSNFNIDGVKGTPRDVLYGWQGIVPNAFNAVGLRPANLGEQGLDAITIGPIIR